MDLICKYFPNLSQKQIQQFSALDKYYKEWNQKINVISRKDIDGLYEKHVLHSLSIAAFYKFKPGSSIIDIGTGGGFPGIPLAIYFPDSHFHLVDSISKKLKVAEAVAAGTGLNNISTQHIRAEEIPSNSNPNQLKKFDAVVSRAVASLKDLWSWSIPLLKNNSESYSGLICLKGGNLEEEIRESRTRPIIKEISEIFSESFFKEKYLLHVRK